jgi:Flp pilus assembly protein TadD
MSRLVRTTILSSAVVTISACATALGTREAPRVEGVVRVAHSTSAVQLAYERGKRLLQEGHHASAAGAFREALLLDPNSLDAMNGLGVALSAAGEYAGASRIFEEILTRNARDAFAMSNLGYVRLLEQRIVEAEDLFERALAIDPANARTRANLAAARAQSSGTAVAETRALTSAPIASAAALPPDPAGGGIVAVAPNVYELRGAGAAASPRESNGANARIVRVGSGVVELRRADSDVSNQPTSPQQNQVVAVTKDVYRLQAPRATGPITPLAAAVAAAQNGAEAIALKVAAESAATQGGTEAILRRDGTSAPSTSIRDHGQDGRIEVSNGNGVRGMARLLAGYLRQQGVGVNRLTNHLGFNQNRTEVQYRDGYRPQAVRLQMTLPVQADLVSSSVLGKDVDVRLVLGRDVVKENVAAWRGPVRIVQVAARAKP